MVKVLLMKKNVYIIECSEDVVFLGQLFITDNTEPVSPISSPR